MTLHTFEIKMLGVEQVSFPLNRKQYNIKFKKQTPKHQFYPSGVRGTQKDVLLCSSVVVHFFTGIFIELHQNTYSLLLVLRR